MTLTNRRWYRAVLGGHWFYSMRDGWYQVDVKDYTLHEIDPLTNTHVTAWESHVQSEVLESILLSVAVIAAIIAAGLASGSIPS